MRRVVTCVLWSLPVLFLFVFLFVFVDRNGRKAWKEAEAKLAACGIVMGRELLMPLPIPPGENFFDTESLDGIENVEVDPKTGNAVGPGEAKRQRLERTVSEEFLTSWAFRANTGTGYVDLNELGKDLGLAGDGDVPTRIVDWLNETDGGLFEELKGAAGRPVSRLECAFGAPPQTWDQLVARHPLHYQPLIHLVSVLKGRAVASIAAHREGDALDSIRIMNRIIEAVGADRIGFLSHQVAVSLETLRIRAIWELLGRGQWSEQGLRDLRAELPSKIDLMESLMKGSLAELWWFMRAADWISAHGPVERAGVDSNWRSWVLVQLLGCNRGWIQHNQAWNANELVDRLIKPLQRENYRLCAKETGRQPVPPWFLFVDGSNSQLVSTWTQKTLVLKTWSDLAQVAVELELFRKRQGHYPEKLEEISGLPVDFMSSRPFHYRRLQEGRFRLYSEGANGVDDGGEGKNPRVSAVRRFRPRFEDLDWVWEYPKE